MVLKSRIFEALIFFKQVYLSYKKQLNIDKYSLEFIVYFKVYFSPVKYKKRPNINEIYTPLLSLNILLSASEF